MSDYSAFDYAVPGPYETELSLPERQAFLQWVKESNIPYNPNQQNQDYDMPGFYKFYGRYLENPWTQGEHFPDTYKTPYHQTFSNESMYAKPNAPHWRENENRWELFHPKHGVLYKE